MKKINWLIIVLIGLLINTSNAIASEIWIGASHIDITPRPPAALDGQMNVRIANSVETPLAANVVVLESRKGATSENVSVFVTCDIVTVPDELKELIQAKAKQEVPNLDVRKIVVNASHTHTGGVVRNGWYDIPQGVMQVKEYQHYIASQVSKAIKSAWQSREKGKVAWGLGHAQVAFNRRAVYESGKAQMYGKTDQDDFRGIEGYEDQSINSLFFWNEKNELLAVSVNIASPAQIVEGRTALNADYWHPVREKLRSRYGKKISVLGWIGAAGDQTPRPIYENAANMRMLMLKGNSNYSTGSKSISFSSEEYMEEIADRIVTTINDTYELVRNDQQGQLLLKHEVKTFQLAARIVTQQEKENCEKSIKEDQATEQRRKDFSRRIAWNQEVIDRFEKQKVNPNPMYSIETHFIRLGDIVICTNPFELFTEYGIQIKARSKALQTFIIQLVGPGTYVPTKKAVEGGHYSAIVQSNRVGYEGGQQLVDYTVRSINDLW